MILKHKSGQAQLLSVIIMGMVLLSMITAILTYSQRVKLSSTRESRVTEMRKALDGAHRLLLQIYRESFCDPVALNSKINFLNPAGQNLGKGTPGKRQLDVQINGRNYLVSIGPVTRIPWENTDDPSMVLDTSKSDILENIVGTSQDVVVEVWTRSGNLTSGADLPTRVTQKAVLINDCQYSCNYTYGSFWGPKMGMCAPSTLPVDPSVGYGRIDPYGTTTPKSYKDYDTTTDVPFVDTDSNAGFIGNVASETTESGGNSACAIIDNEPVDSPPSMTGKATVDVRDLVVFRDQLRTGASTGTCPTRFNGSDMNGDGVINEIDLVIFEKLLRGYIYKIPVTH